MMYVLIICMALFAIVLFSFSSKASATEEDSMIPLFINRWTLGLFVSICYVLWCLFHHFRLGQLFPDDGAWEFISMLFYLPLALPFFVGFTSGNAVGITVLIVQTIIISPLFAGFIPKSWIEKCRSNFIK